VAIARIRRCNAPKSVVMVGLRGVGKTAILDRARNDADDCGAHTLRIEPPQNRALQGLPEPQLRLVLLRLSRVEAAKNEVGLVDPDPGLADNGDLEMDLTAPLEEVGLAARNAKTAVVLFIDELQYLHRDQFGALISSPHRSPQSHIPLTVVGAGSPQLRGLAGNAKSYAEGLFDFPTIGALARSEAEWPWSSRRETKASSAGMGKTRRGSRRRSPITPSEVTAGWEATAALDKSFFRYASKRIIPESQWKAEGAGREGAGQEAILSLADGLSKRIQ